MLEYLAQANESAQESDPSGLVGVLFIIGCCAAGAVVIGYNAWKLHKTEIDETVDSGDPLRPRDLY